MGNGRYAKSWIISIHAPSRERLCYYHCYKFSNSLFQSTLPRGSDSLPLASNICNPISIHAPSRERRQVLFQRHPVTRFQSTLPRGSDYDKLYDAINHDISIHAPSRERPDTIRHSDDWFTFQSTLPRGSDFNSFQCLPAANHFNPRSLAGATNPANLISFIQDISIHAPSRERLIRNLLLIILRLFQSTLPRGSDSRLHNFACWQSLFQSTLPRGSDPIH